MPKVLYAILLSWYCPTNIGETSTDDRCGICYLIGLHTLKEKKFPFHVMVRESENNKNQMASFKDATSL